MQTAERREIIHITPQVEQIVRRSGIQDGLIEDIMEWLEKVAPARPEYRHHQTGEDNADAHLKALMLHHETTLPITSGKLDLGTWQRVFYAEFDGQRKKRIIVKAIGVL